MAEQTVRAAVAAKEGGEQPGTDLEPRQHDRLDAMVAHIRGEVEKQLVKHIPADYFLRTVETGMRRSPALAKLSASPDGRKSLYAAMLEAARWGLMPFTKDGAIVPFGKEAVFIPQWQGLVKTMYNSGMVAAVEARLIHARDEWALAYGDTGGFYHRPMLIDADGNELDRGKPVLAYCFVRLRDGNRTAVSTCTRQEAIEVRDRYSRSYRQAEQNGKKDSAWHTNFDEMWIKTAIRSHYDSAPSSPELREVFLAAARDDVHRPLAADAPAPDSAWTAEVLSDTEDMWNGGEEPPPPPPPDRQEEGGQLDRNKLMRQMHALFRDGGIDKVRDVQNGVLAVLLRPSPEAQPVTVPPFSELATGDLATAVGKLVTLKAEAKTGDRPLHDDLMNLARAGGYTGGEPDA